MPIFLCGASSQVLDGDGGCLINYLDLNITDFQSRSEAVGMCHITIDEHSAKGKEVNRFVVTQEYSQEKLLELAKKARSQVEIDADT